MPAPKPDPLPEAQKDNSDIISALNQELAAYWPPYAYVSQGVAFDMQAVLNKCRKNFWGVFDQSKDPTTGVKKTWVPLTEAMCETVIKNVNIDTKDIQVLPRRPDDFLAARFIRPLVKFLLDRMGFGQIINDLLRAMVIDGTVVLKSFKGYSKAFQKKITKTKIVDLFNFYIDPTSDSIQDSASIIERVVLSPVQIEEFSKNGWKNTESITMSTQPFKTPDTYLTSPPTVPYGVIYERWGLVRESWIQIFEAKEPTSSKWVEGVIIGSGDGGSQPTFKNIHFIGLNKKKDGWKPYEECWYRRAQNRWYGRGVAEQLFHLQEYLNAIFNIRKNNAFVLQNGLFLIRKGSGITAQMISSLTAGGAIPVTSLEQDIKQLPVQDVRQSSYKDESTAMDWSRLVSMGLTTPSDVAPSAPATIGLLANQQIKDVFGFIKEGVGMTLERMLQRHLIPSFLEELDSGELLRITGMKKELMELDEIYVDQEADIRAYKYAMETGFVPSDVQLEDFKQKIRTQLQKQSNARFVEFRKSLFDFDYDIKVNISDESLSRSVVAQQLRDMAIAYSRIPGLNIDIERVFAEMMNTLGLDIDLYKKVQAPQPLQAMAGFPLQSPRPVQEMPASPPTEMAQFGVANQFNNLPV